MDYGDCEDDSLAGKCDKTCGLCTDGTTTVVVTTNVGGSGGSTTTTTSGSSGSTESECKDEVSYCDVDFGDCKITSDELKNCKKTCGLC